MRRKSIKSPPCFDLEAIYGKEWGEIQITPDGLFLPGWRRPFSPGELRSLFWQLQELTILRHEAVRLRRERQAAHEAAEAATDRAEWYRRQLRLESSLGAMLGRVTA